MVKLHLELEGDVDEVVRVLRRIGGGDNGDGEVRDGPRPAPTGERTSAVDTVPEPGTTATSAALPPGRWTEELAADFTAGLDVVARRVMFQVWRAGERGIHRNVLCQQDRPGAAGVALVGDEDGSRAGEVPAGAGHGAVAAGGGQQPAAELLRRSRIRRDGGVPDVRREDGGPAVQWLAAPLTNACHAAPGRTNRALVLNTLLLIVGLWIGLACGGDTDDRMVRRYAVCLMDTSTTPHRLTTSGARGTVMLSAEAMEERLRGQLERGELTMGEIRADYARYCK